MTEEKKQPKKRIQLVDVVLERKGSQMFEGRRVRSPEDAANIIRDFIGDSDREKFVVLGLSTKNLGCLSLPELRRTLSND